MLSDALRELLGHSDYGDSRSILGAAIRRSIEAVSWAETQLNQRKDSIGNILRDHAPPEDVIFLLRSGPVRYRLAALLSALTESESLTDAEDAYLALRLPFDAYAAASGKESGADRLHGAGFDLDGQLTEPYPYVMTAWRGSEHEGANGWSESRSVEQMFISEMADTVGKVPCVLRPLEDKYFQRFDRALEGLSSIDPSLARDIVANVRHVCMIDFPGYETRADDEYREIGQSVSSHLVPGCCFFSLHSIVCADRLAEALYHEALHKKLSNLLDTKSILKRDYDALTAPRFHCYWNKDTRWNSNRWEFDRALYAYHVYVHLHVLYCDRTVCDSGTFSQEWLEMRRPITYQRQAALGDWLRSQAGKCIGANGEDFLKFLSIQANAMPAVEA